jgi:uncharacterized protein YwgA
MAAEDVRDVIQLNGGQIVGRTRLQKSFYFLEALGLGFGFDYDYHYYGPYSEDLALSASDATALGLIEEATDVSQSGQPYSIYRALAERSESGARDEDRRRILTTLHRQDAITLELAATAHFLARTGFAGREWDETKRRKSLKASPIRIERAQALLGELGLA